MNPVIEYSNVGEYKQFQQTNSNINQKQIYKKSKLFQRANA